MIELFLNLLFVRVFCASQNLQLFLLKTEIKQNPFLVVERALRYPASFFVSF